MNKISKKDFQEITNVHNSLELQRGRFNSLSLELHAKIQAVISAFVEDNESEIEAVSCEYESSQDQLTKLVTKQTEKMDNYLSERSDGWHDKDAGCVFNDWLDSWNEYLSQIQIGLDTYIFDGLDLTRSEPNDLPLATKPKL